MTTRSIATALILIAGLAGCGSSAPTQAPIASGGNTGSGASSGANNGQPTAQLAMLSLAEAPAATKTFFWGMLDASAPGFATSPQDQLTIGLGSDNGLRYMSWQTMPAGGLPKTYGDGPQDFPLSGTRRVDLNPAGYALVFDQVTVLDSPAPTATHFLLKSRYVSIDNKCDFVESIEGTRVADGWSIVYSQEGTLFIASVSASAHGMVYPRDPNAVAAPAGQPSRWSAPVELTAPDFYGPPVDHLGVALDSSGQLRWFAFQNFTRKVSLTGGTQDLPSGGFPIANEGSVTFNDVVPATSDHFVIRYRVYSDAKLNDYTEGIDGTRQGDTLVVRYFISGKLWGAAINGHAAGTLVPASPAVNAGPQGSGGTSGSGGIGGAGMGGAGGS
jgi:hypothetical protein